MTATTRPELPFRIIHESSKIFVNVILTGCFIHVNNAILKRYGKFRINWEGVREQFQLAVLNINPHTIISRFELKREDFNFNFKFHLNFLKFTYLNQE